MNRSLIKGTILSCAVATGMLLGVAGIAQSQTKPAPKPAGTKSFSTWAVVQPVTGSFQKVDSYLATFMKEFSGQGLDAKLLGYDPTSIMVVYEDPAGKKEVRMAVGFTVPASLDVKEPLKLEHFQFPQASSEPFQGPYQGLGRAHAKLATSLKARSVATSWPVIVKLLNDPRKVKPDAIRSEMVVPAGATTGAAVPEAAPAPDGARLYAANTAANQKAAPLASTSMAKIQQAVRAPRAVSYTLVAESFTGSVSQIGDFLHKFMNDFNAQDLGKNLASRDVAPIAILYGNPDQNKEIKIAIGLPVKARVPVKEPLALLPFATKRAVDYLHVGSYGQLSAVHGEIVQGVRKAAPNAKAFAAATKEPGFPVALRLLTDPAKVQTPQTEVIVPVDPVK
jgi:effector-binding domain-containing protein